VLVKSHADSADPFIRRLQIADPGSGKSVEHSGEEVT
jgi:hypothetical protein